MRALPLACLLALPLLAGCPQDGHGDHDHAGPGDLGVRPLAAPVTGDSVWVVNGGSNGVTVIDAATRTVRGTVGLVGTRFPHHVNLSPDGAFLVIADPGMDFSMGHDHTPMPGHEGALVKLDARNGSLLAARWLTWMNHNGAISADGTEVWTTEMNNPGQALVLDAATLEEKARVQVGNGATEVTLSPDGTTAWVANGAASTVTVIDTATRAVRATLPAGLDPVGAWPGRDGRMYVDAERGQGVTVIDATSLQAVRALQLGFMPGMVAALPSGEVWVSDATNGRVVVYGPEGGAPLAAIPTGAGAHGLAFDPEGRTLWVTNQHAASVSVVDVAERRVLATVDVGDKPNGLVYRRAP